MNKKSMRNLAVLAAVLVAACLVYVIIIRVSAANEAREASESEAASEAARIFVTDMTDADHLEINTGEETLSFTKTDDTWYYDEDENFPVNQDDIQTVADAASKLEATRELTGGDALEDYGFTEDNEISLTVSNADGDSVTLQYGSDVNEEYYFKTADSDTVYTVDTSLYNAISGMTLYDFVQMETLPTSTVDGIERVEVTLDGETYSFEKPEEEETEAETESETAAEESSEDAAETEEETETETESPEEEAFSNLSAAIPGMSIEACINYYVTDDELADYGLDNPYMTLEYTFTNSDDETQTQVINIGDKFTGDDDSEYYYIQLDGSNAVNSISAGSVDGLIGYVEESIE